MFMKLEYRAFSSIFFWDSLHARLNSHYEVWIYKKKRNKNLEKSLYHLEMVTEKSCNLSE